LGLLGLLELLMSYSAAANAASRTVA